MAGRIEVEKRKSDLREIAAERTRTAIAAEQLSTAAKAADALVDSLREAYSGAGPVALEIVLSDLLRQSVEIHRTLARLAEDAEPRRED